MIHPQVDGVPSSSFQNFLLLLTLADLPVSFTISSAIYQYGKLPRMDSEVFISWIRSVLGQSQQTLQKDKDRTAVTKKGKRLSDLANEINVVLNAHLPKNLLKTLEGPIS